ncbi:MAG: glutathione S-transferase family protein [Parvibaculum sp.]|uniref:glutathione S-transferase family protein n=1 Tax=Parvibaculum sp. TaxID=2024848 RepID=UPI001B072D5E|nr:glutathione S-transferase family protein [Parvibaculum sp.]MBO6633006.1 glutathione S-transferase family protein [Parvibaculum sp.]
MASGTIIVHGLTLSYFTGKLEAWLRARGIPYRFEEMDTHAFRRAGRATGVLQMPQVEMPDGSWFTDTTAIMADFEKRFPGPALSPRDPAARFASLLLEDHGDEWLWRPALHYRWSFAEDMTLMSAQIARTMLRDVKLPFWLRRQVILRRQRRVYLAEDGVTKETAPQIEALYLETLDAMEAVLARRPFLMGERPVQADFGFFGSMFRHFSSDPTPAAIMRARAPHVLLWVARLWAAQPGDIEKAALPASVPDDLVPIFARIASDYLPYLAANEAVLAQGDKHVRYSQSGVHWDVPVSPSRAHCLSALRKEYASLDQGARSKIDALLGEGAELLCGPAIPNVEDTPEPRPASRPADRHWRRAAGRKRT